MSYQNINEDEIEGRNIEDMSDSELFLYIDQDMNYSMSEEGEGGVVIGRDVYPSDLIKIDKFVKNVMRNVMSAFVVRDLRGRRVAKISPWFKPYFRSLAPLLDIYRPEYEYSPRVDLFFSFGSEVQFLHDYSKDQNTSMPSQAGKLFGENTILADGYNSIIDLIRGEYKTRDIDRKFNKRAYNSKLNYQHACEYVNWLFSKYAKLLSLRLDVGYREGIAQGVNVDKIMSDYEKFLQRRRSKKSIFKHMVGFIARLEYSNLKGYHFHLMLFFDGSKVQNHSYYAEQAGIYWRDIVTAGAGTYYNCNRHPNRYKRCGIGRVGHQDDVKRSNVLYALSYLTKSEQYVMVKRTKGGRTFFMGQPRERTSKAGRPRTRGEAN